MGVIPAAAVTAAAPLPSCLRFRPALVRSRLAPALARLDLWARPALRGILDRMVRPDLQARRGFPVPLAPPVPRVLRVLPAPLARPALPAQLAPLVLRVLPAPLARPAPWVPRVLRVLPAP